MGPIQTDMLDELELESLRRHPAWRVALQRYHDLHSQAKLQSPEFDGWVPRVFEMDEINPAELASIHGKLIAFGLLKFELAGRDDGMRYQLTPLGKRIILGDGAADEEAADDESPLAMSA